MRGLLALVLLAGCALPVIEADDVARASPPPSLSGLDQIVHHQANVARRTSRTAPLDWSDDLAAVAEMHSRAMARDGRFDHLDARGEGAVERLRRAGIACRTTAENLYLTTRYQSVGRSPRGAVYDWFTARELAQRTINGWLESPGHRRNLLDAGLQRHGIGVAIGGGQRVYITQVLCR